MEFFHWISDGVKWLMLAIISLLAWVYKQDRVRMDRYGEKIAALEATRPERTELTTAVNNLRHEMRADLADLKTEIRTDFAELRKDVNARLDILIQLAKEK